MYNLYKMNEMLELQGEVLRLLNGQIDSCYLAGGTALSLIYFQHRGSFDLDFFTDDFNEREIKRIIKYLEDKLEVEISLVESQSDEKFAKMLVYSIPVKGTKISLRLDFIEDVYALLESTKRVEGVSILSLSDIYLRKVYTTCGGFVRKDDVGRDVFYGGRQEAKDFFDLYYLSTTYLPLSDFVSKHCKQTEKESIIVWYRRYDRMMIKVGLLDIITPHNPDYREMDKHFKKEIDKIILEEIVGEI